MIHSDIEVLLRQAVELQTAGQDAEAAKILQTVLQRVPDQPDALHLLAQIAHTHQNFDIARDLYKKSLEIDPDQHNVWALYGKVLYDLRQIEEAEQALLKALEIKPDYGQAHKHLAQFALSRGDNEKAIEHAMRAIEINPMISNAYLTIARARKLTPDDPLVATMHDLAKQFEGRPQPASHIQFALSYVYEASRDVEKFFHHLTLANAALREPDDAHRVEVAKHHSNIRKTMTSEFLAKRVDEKHKLYTPIFIVGMPRSGTTLLDQIFATHSQCFGGDELLYFPKYLNRLATAKTGKKDSAGYSELEASDLAQVAQLYQQRVHLLAPEAQFISDKLPWNYEMIGMISAILPWAKIIHIHRDPMDCGWSVYRNPLQKGIWFSTNMESYVWYRKQYQDMMNFWQQTMPDSFINVAYESLVENPEQEIRRITNYCGLPWEDRLLDFHQTKREIHTVSSGQVIKPLNKSSIGSAERYPEQLKPMKNALKKYGLI